MTYHNPIHALLNFDTDIDCSKSENSSTNNTTVVPSSCFSLCPGSVPTLHARGGSNSTAAFMHHTFIYTCVCNENMHTYGYTNRAVHLNVPVICSSFCSLATTVAEENQDNISPPSSLVADSWMDLRNCRVG